MVLKGEKGFSSEIFFALILWLCEKVLQDSKLSIERANQCFTKVQYIGLCQAVKNILKTFTYILTF